MTEVADTNGAGLPPPGDRRDLAVADVTLGTYAAIHAGFAEEIALEMLLEHEGVEAGRWPTITRAWLDRLADDAEQGGVLCLELDALMAEAQDRIERRIPPLDEELQCWLDFLRRWPEGPDPMATLEELGMRAADLGRLHRLWNRRLDADPALRKRAEEILKDEPGALPVVQPTAPKLPSASVPQPPTAPTPSAEPAKGARSAERKSQVEPPPEEIPPLFVPLPGREQAPAVSPPPAVPPVVRPPALVPAPAPIPPVALSAATPDPTAASAPIGRDAAPSSPSASRRAFTGLPFKPSAAEPALGGQRSQPSAPTEPSRARPAFSGLPFKTADPVVGSAPPAADSAASTAAADSAASTAPEGEPKPAPSAPTASRPFFSGLPFKSAAPIDQGSDAGAPTAEPPAEMPGPSLTVEQHASLCAELATFPDDAEATFAEHGLASPELRSEVDAAWRRRLASDPFTQRTWNRLYWAFRSYWATRPRRG